MKDIMKKMLIFGILAVSFPTVGFCMEKASSADESCGLPLKKRVCRECKAAIQRSMLEAAGANDWRTLEPLLDANPTINVNVADERGITLLMWEVLWDNVEMVDKLIKRGARVDDRDVTRKTALTWAVISLGNGGLTPSMRERLTRGGHEARLLLNSCFSEPHYRPRTMNPSPRFGESIAILIENGALFTLPDNMGRSAYDYASTIEGQEDVVAFFKEHGK